MSGISRYGKLVKLFIFSSIMAALFLMCILIIYINSFRDPRWRIFDYNSRQVTEGEIYNVAEIPAVTSVELTGERTLRFAFIPPIRAKSWAVRAQSDNSINSQNKYPEIQFPNEPYTDTFDFIPEGMTLMKDISITVSFYPGERYEAAGLSWPDNYYSPWSSVPFSLGEAWSLDEWAGLPEDDPELIEARDILELARFANVHTQKPLTEGELRFIAQHPDLAAQIMTMAPRQTG